MSDESVGSSNSNKRHAWSRDSVYLQLVNRTIDDTKEQPVNLDRVKPWTGNVAGSFAVFGLSKPARSSVHFACT